MLTKLSFSAAFNIRLFLVYSEYTCVLVYSKLGINKLKSLNVFVIVNSTTLYIFTCFSMCTELWFKSSLLLFKYHISDCFFSTCFGFLVKYRMKGLGHRIFVRKSNFLYKLGYSHFIYKQLDLDLTHSPKRYKKKPFFAIRGIDIVNLRNAIFVIQSYRLPNCYDKNGIFVRDIVVEWKQGKKGFML